MFENRTEAGERLAERVRDRGIEADIVLAVPRGGLPVGRTVADALGVPLDIVAARKIGAPGNPELAIGAVASDGTVWLNEDHVAAPEADDDYVEAAKERERKAAQRTVERYRRGHPPLELRGKTVLVVDDGVATGATTTACIRQLRSAGAARVVLAVPVGPPDVIERLREEADDVVCVEMPPNFRAVGQFYRSFEQVSDEDAASYLR